MVPSARVIDACSDFDLLMVLIICDKKKGDM
jgi:hypothetical protein